MLEEICDIQIAGLCAAVPSNQVLISEYASDILTEKEARRLSKNTGFHKLRISDEWTFTSDLCFKAAKNLLHKLEISADTIDGLIFISQTPDSVLPATSHILQEKLGLSNHPICFDINEGCSGYIQGLYLSTLLLKSGLHKRILLLAGDTISKLTSPTDRATRCIFGDGGSATILEQGNQKIAYHLESFGSGANIIQAFNHRNTSAMSAGGGHLSLRGMEVMNFTLDEVPKNIEKLMRFQKETTTAINFFACHQANRLILESLAEKLHVEKEKLPFMAGEIGNTSSASIPLLLTQCKDLFSMDKVLCSGFGVGLSIASCIADFSQTKILDVMKI